ncbi:MAG: PaaX family transcriptional regulator C-terminal domain-containing protein [Carboxydocellales bacterium]
MDIRPPGKRLVRTQSMLFTLMGDYIRYHKDKFPAVVIIKMMKELGYSESSVRSALSRLCQNNWLKNEHEGRKSYYWLTKQSEVLLEQGYRRIFHLQQIGQWDGIWYIVNLSIPEKHRNLRVQLRKELTWNGFGTLAHGCLISPYDSFNEVDSIVNRLQANEYVHFFKANYQGFLSHMELVMRCWELEKINDSYKTFLSQYEKRYHQKKKQLESKSYINVVEYFVERVNLIHGYRRFPFQDPGLPPELLPKEWLGFKVAALLKEYHQFLQGPADKFVDSLFEK